MRILLIVVIWLAVSHPGWAQQTDGISIDIGVVAEMAKRPYTFTFASGEMTVGGQPFRLQYDRFDRGLERVWLNYGMLRLVQEKNITATYQPGVFANSRGAWYIGGSLTTKIKPLNLTVWQRSGGGNRGAFHLWLSRIQLSKEFFVQHTLKMQDGIPATSYLGPGITMGNGQIVFWGGRSLTSDPAWSVNAKVQFKF